MALSDAIKIKVVRYLGYGVQVINEDSNQYLSQVADHLGNLDPFAESVVIDLVKRLDRMDERLEGALDRLVAKEVDEIVLRDDELEKLRAERSKIINELGRSLDIKPMGVSSVMVGVCV